jgi:hypothetical protein
MSSIDLGTRSRNGGLLGIFMVLPEWSYYGIPMFISERRMAPGLGVVVFGLGVMFLAMISCLDMSCSFNMDVVRI